MNTCCQNVSQFACSIVGILQRIVPIQYTSDGVLFIDAPVSVEDALSIGGAEISVVGNHLNLPARTLINGVPLLSDAFLQDIISLPLTTKINGYYPITEQYYYYFNAQEGSFSYGGYIVNGKSSPVNVRTASRDPHGFSFIVPENCVLTSLKVLYVLKSGIFGSPTSASIFIDVVDTNLNPYYTGVFLTIPKPAASSRTLVETEFEYFVQKGDSVAVWVQGDAQFLGAVTPFAILGFKVLPTGTPLSLVAPQDPFYTSPLRAKVEPSLYNRFPFNNILNTIAQQPIQLEDQFRILRSGATGIYGRSLTPSDYNTRLFSNSENRALAHQDGFAYLFSHEKTEEGTFLDVSLSFRNTRILETQYHWKGVLVSSTKSISVDKLVQHDMPAQMDFLSFDLVDLSVFETLLPVFSHFQFGFASIRHNDDPDARARTREVMLSHGYTRLFANVLMLSDRGDWTAMEDWHAHPDIVDPVLLQTIVEHPDNTENILFTTCAEIVKTIQNM